MQTVQFKPTSAALSQCVGIIIISGLPFALYLATDAIMGLKTLIFLSIITSLIIYTGLEAIFSKKLVLKDGNLIFHNGPFDYKLNPEKMTIYYEKISIFERRYKERFGLVLYRNKDKIMGFTLNNKFILDYEMSDTKLDIYQKEFADKLGIKINIVDSFF